MADQIFSVSCGFFDAIDRDRVYSAAQMNMPYKRLVSNGVFATASGTPSTDLQVSAGTGRAVQVAPGNGLFGDRWLENPAVIPITVPANTALTGRIDSVIVQVSLASSGRSGSIIYRTGTPAAAPVPPELGSGADLYEYRLANVAVASGASSITAADITDCRGSADCPWVTSLIYQVDTSVLWAQYQAAYRQYFDMATSNFNAYVAQQQQAWEDFLAHAAAELDVTPSVMTLRSSYVTETAARGPIPIDIASFDRTSDVLQVYVNGLQAQEGVMWVYLDGAHIVFNAELPAGQRIDFVVFKSLVTAELNSVVSLIQRLDEHVSGAIGDSGWQSVMLTSPYQAATGALCNARKIGSAVYVRGAVTGYDSGETEIGHVPISMTPAQDVLLTVAPMASGTPASMVLRIAADTGAITIDAASSSGITSSSVIPIDAVYLSDTGYGTEMVFAYRGSVANYTDLPPAQIGDVYTVLNASPGLGIEAGDAVLWDGAAWEVVATTITAAQIDDVLNDYF